MPNPKIFASPQDVEAAFYEALERCDIDAMMAVWAEDAYSTPNWTPIPRESGQ